MSEGKLNNCYYEEGRSPDVAISAIFLTLLFPFSAQAECTPTPDCASIGYTETSCETDYLACPFDSTKLKCIPCDSSFRYDCSGDNITGGEGNTCGGKYGSCECESGYSFNNGDCFCPNIVSAECLVGTIYYPNGKCSNDYVACLNPVGVVVKDNALVMSWRSSSAISWGAYETDVDTLTNITSSNSIARTDYDGATHTSIIVATHSILGETNSTSAAIYCNEYAPTGMESSQGQWYLPAAGELYDYVYGNYNTLLNIYKTYLGYSSFGYWFWSSSEADSNYSLAVASWNGIIDYYDKYVLNAVTCFLAI